MAHYHGGFPSRNRWFRVLQQRAFARVDRFCFSTRSHAQPFLDARLIRDGSRIVELMETSSTFVPRDREISRQATRMVGEPVFLSVGRLHPVKDPMTMLRGFERVLSEWPRADLYLYLHIRTNCCRTSFAFSRSVHHLARMCICVAERNRRRWRRSTTAPTSCCKQACASSAAVRCWKPWHAA